GRRRAGDAQAASRLLREPGLGDGSGRDLRRDVAARIRGRPAGGGEGRPGRPRVAAGAARRARTRRGRARHQPLLRGQPGLSPQGAGRRRQRLAHARRRGPAQDDQALAPPLAVRRRTAGAVAGGTPCPRRGAARARRRHRRPADARAHPERPRGAAAAGHAARRLRADRGDCRLRTSPTLTRTAMSRTPNTPPEPPLWGAVAMLGTTQIVAWGSQTYGIAVLAPSIAGELGLGMGTVFGAFSLGLGFSGLAAPAAGRAIDRLGGGRVMAVGSVLAAIAMAMVALSQGPLLFFAGWIVAGLA